MGASGWTYFTPYEDNIQHALDQLRAAVFQRGDYVVRPAFQADDMPFDAFLPTDLAEDEREEFRAQYEELQDEVQPESFATIAELLDWNGEDGTHSILDVHMVVSTPLEQPLMRPRAAADDQPFDMRAWLDCISERMGKVYPLSDQQLHTCFGTTQPTHDMVVRAEAQLDVLCERGEGRYIIVYTDSLPAEICFIGCSGD